MYNIVIITENERYNFNYVRDFMLSTNKDSFVLSYCSLGNKIRSENYRYIKELQINEIGGID